MQKGLPVRQAGFAPILIVILIALAVGGYLIYQNQPKPVVISQPIVQPTSAPIISPIASASAAETANWKTYTSNKYGFSYKYPQDFKIVNELQVNQYRRYNEDSLALFSPDIKVDPDGKITEGIGLAIGVITSKSQTELDAEMKGNSESSFDISSFKLPTGSNINSYKTGSSADINIFIGSPPQESIHLACEDPKGTGRCVGLLIQILSTFKFTP
ncbi:MAG: hypothetical protein Q7R97_02220 [Candidatus Daviesbacteria bacterium]|nr:hypothetical protein [Candidatus Daviesbacteria bacterium]